jgi:hypothetical protein
MDAAKCFVQQVLQTVGHAPERVTTDGHTSSPRAIREILGSDVVHRTNHSLNNRLEQDHRGIKQRYYPMRGFGNFPSASRFCRAFDEVHQFFRVRSIMRTTYFSGATTRNVPSTIGNFESPGAGGVTHTHLGEECRATMLAPAFSVLTHPTQAIIWLITDRKE